jgi:hypothetical protein
MSFSAFCKRFEFCWFLFLFLLAFLPVAFCLQETHLKKSDNINLKKYSVYSTYVDEDERAVGGSTILARDNILHSYVNLNTDLQAVAVQIHNPSWEIKS